MPEYDLVIRGGTVVDGTGIPRHKADVAVKGGKVAKISGKIPAGGGKEIDASGCIVAPGAIDLHTHYDGQLNWDPYCSLSGWFGVTSLTIGQCGFGFAPTRPEDRELNMRMMNRIEAIPLESMRKGMRWDWETFPEYLDSLDKQGLGVNVGSLFPFSPLRGYVLGMLDARERTSVTEAELNQMKQLFHEAMKAGAFGFSADMNVEDRPEDGSNLPSHVASREEYMGLAEVLGEFGVGHIGWTLGLGHSPEGYAGLRNTLEDMMRVSGRPAHADLGDDAGLAWFDKVHDDGLVMLLQQVCLPLDAEFKLAEYNLFDYMPSWRQPLIGTAEERAVKLRKAETRAAMKRDVEENPHNRTNWERLVVLEASSEVNRKYEGKSVGQIARDQGKHPLDAFLDVALAENLQTEFVHPADLAQQDEDTRARWITHPYSHISVSDGGAHTRYLTLSNWPLYFLSHWVRDRDIMTLEQAHYKMSALPAWFADFKGRGTLRVGSWADVIVYKQDELGFLYDRPVFAHDFPGEEMRLIQKPKGLRYTIVNGAVTFEGSDCTGALPGKLLRSYEMVD